MDHKPTVRQFIIENFFVPDPDTVGDEDGLLESGVVDSTGVLEVIQFVEGRFGIAMADEEIVPENLGSIARIAAYVERKLRQASARGGIARVAS